MTRFSRFALIAALSAIALPALPALADPAAPGVPQQHASTRHKAVFELSSAPTEGWNALLKNLENLVAHYGAANAQFEVVAHGQGIGLMLKTNAKLATRMAALSKQGVVFAACNNTMKHKNIAKADLLAFVTVVPAGVAEVIEKQEAGWAYIKAGH